MIPLTDPNVRFGAFAVFYDPLALPPVPLIPQAWTRAVLNLAFGVLVWTASAAVGGFVLISNLQGVELEGTLAEDCLAWDAVGMVLVTIPAGTVVRFPNGPVPCERTQQFAEFSPGQSFGL